MLPDCPTRSNGVILQQPSSATNDTLMSMVLAKINQVSALLGALAGDHDHASLLTESFSTSPLNIPSSDLILSDLGKFTENQLDFDGSDLSIGSLGSMCSVPLVLSASLSPQSEVFLP